MSKPSINPDNPWQLRDTRLVYDNPWIRVREDQVLNPKGNPGIYGVVSYKNTAVGIIPLDAQGWTWLVGQYRYPLDVYSWEIPMGGGPKGTDPLAAAQRELAEETGIRAARWSLLLRAHLSNCVSDEEGFVFLAEQLSMGESMPDETERLDLWHLPFGQALEMVLAGEITDSLSVAGILRCARQLGV